MSTFRASLHGVSTARYLVIAPLAAPDPGGIEVNIHTAGCWDELVENTTELPSGQRTRDRGGPSRQNKWLLEKDCAVTR